MKLDKIHFYDKIYIIKIAKYDFNEVYIYRYNIMEKEEFMAEFYHIFIEEILTTISKIKEIVYGKAYDEFKGNYHLVDNVIRYLNIIGEACKHIPEEVREGYQNVPWNTLLDLRNVLHNPEHVELVWNFATEKLPEIKNDLKSVMS